MAVPMLHAVYLCRPVPVAKCACDNSADMSCIGCSPLLSTCSIMWAHQLHSKTHSKPLSKPFGKVAAVCAPACACRDSGYTQMCSTGQVLHRSVTAPSYLPGVLLLQLWCLEEQPVVLCHMRACMLCADALTAPETMIAYPQEHQSAQASKQRRTATLWQRTMNVDLYTEQHCALQKLPQWWTGSSTSCRGRSLQTRCCAYKNTEECVTSAAHCNLASLA